MKEKIYLFIALMGVGGAERVMVTLANALAEKGREVHVIVLNLENDVNTHLLNPACRIHSLGVSRMRYAPLAMYRFLKKEKPESILVFGDSMAYMLNAMRKLRLLKIKIVLRLLNNVNVTYKKEDHVPKTVEHYLKNQQKNLKDMETVICQCQAMKQMLLDRNLLPENKTEVIYNPVNKELVRQSLEKRSQRPENTKKQIVFAGRLDPQKNPEHLIRAFAMVHGRNPDTQLRLVGDGVLRGAMEQLTEELQLTDCVSFEGIRKDMENLYGFADVAVLTSDYEGMPNFLIEAVSCGIPVAAYDCPIGPAEIVVEGINGYLVPLHDMEGLAAKIEQAMTQSFDEAAIRKTAEKFSASLAAEQVLALLEKDGL